MEFPQVLQELMDNSNLKPYGLSKLMGCSQSSVRNWLMGERKPYASTMSRLADIFGVTPAQLEGEETIDFGSLMKAPVRPSVGPAVDDEDDAADESLSAPLTSEEAVEFLTLLHEDSDFRVLCRTYGKVTRKSGRQFKDKIQKLKGENE